MVQTRLSSPVVSNEEVQVFYSCEGDEAGHDIWLPARIHSKTSSDRGQEPAAREGCRFSDYRLNAADFTDRRSSARFSDRIMFREQAFGITSSRSARGQR